MSCSFDAWQKEKPKEEKKTDCFKDMLSCHQMELNTVAVVTEIKIWYAGQQQD